MALLDQIITGKKPVPPRVMIYGPEGIGKSTFGANAPKAVFIQTENGLTQIDCARLPLVKTFDELIEQLKAIRDEPHEFATLCIDSLDWEVALKDNNAQGYQHYLELHPDGLFSAIATDSKTRLAKLEVSNEERSMLSGSLDNFLSAMASGDEGRVNSLISSTMNFCGETNATGANVVSFQKLNFHHDDIIGVHFTVGGLNIKKKPSDATPGAYDFVVNASLDAVLNRTNTDSTGVQAWKITATLSPDRKFRSVDMRKQ